MSSDVDTAPGRGRGMSRRRFGRGLAALAGTLALVGPTRSGAAEGAPLVAAASSVRFALDEILAAFRGETGLALRISYGSSGNLYRQILQGAPFQLFLSADEAYVRALARAGRTLDGGTVYARGRIVLAARNGSPLEVDPELAGLRRWLDDDPIGRFAIANPRTAPYGMRAEEALRDGGVWEAVAPMLVYGETVSQAAQFVVSAAVDGGIIALAHAVSPRLSDRITFALIAESRHRPLIQRQVLLKGAGPAARAFHDFIRGPAAGRVLTRNGFTIPDRDG